VWKIKNMLAVSSLSWQFLPLRVSAAGADDDEGITTREDHE
jgi:hypothetical protein